MTRVAGAPFDYAALDGMAFAVERGRMSGHTQERLVARDLGPVLELGQLAAGGLLPAPERAEWLALDGVGALYRALASGRSQWVCSEGGRIGFLRTASKWPKDETIWTGFGLAVQQAAKAAGFPIRVAGQLTAALGEMRSNIHEHSGAPGTGLIAFRAGLHRFEFVAADRGMGVLESLRSCSDYSGLSDHGDALRLTLSDGASRFGANTGRGKGFRPLFVGLANLNGSLRFRSGDHALTMDGQNPSLIEARTSQKLSIQGFFASVACKTAVSRGQNSF